MYIFTPSGSQPFPPGGHRHRLFPENPQNSTKVIKSMTSNMLPTLLHGAVLSLPQAKKTIPFPPLSSLLSPFP